MYQPLIKFHPYPAIITQVLRIFVFRVFDKLKWNAKDTAFRVDKSLPRLLPYTVY